MAFGRRTGDRSAARGSGAMSPFFLGSNILIWLSAIIVMGLTAFFVSEAHELGREASNHVLYILVISVLTVAFFLAAFFLGTWPGYVLLFNLIFSYLWLVAVVFTVEDYNIRTSGSDYALTVEAFSFIAFFFLFFNVLYAWHLAYRATPRTTAVV